MRPLVARMAKIGLVPGQDFDPSKLGVFDKEAIKAVPKLGQAKIIEFGKKVEPVNGWLVFHKTGLYGTDCWTGPSSPPSVSAPTGPRMRLSHWPEGRERQ